MDNNININPNQNINLNERAKKLNVMSINNIIINTSLAFLMLSIGLISGSPAVISDGIHTFSDVFTTVMVMVGIKLSSEAADKEHPYGHQRIESLISFILSLVLAVTAILLGWSGVNKLLNNTHGSPSILAVGVTVLAIAFREFMFWYTYKLGKKYNSSSVIADAWHHRSDAMSSVAVLIGVVGVFFNIYFLENIAVIVVCLMILYVAFGIFKNAINQLIDKSANQEIREKIESLAIETDGVQALDLLRTRISNNIIFAELEISVDPQLSVAQGHEIARNIHDSIEALDLQECAVAHCMVHVNPYGLGEH